jgi:hypothetical protein
MGVESVIVTVVLAVIVVISVAKGTRPQDHTLVSVQFPVFKVNIASFMVTEAMLL